jgi:DNA repair protein RadC
MKVLYLTSQNQIIDTADLFEGTVNSSSVVPRQIVEQALVHNAAALIFAHNHPSGNCEPSKSDKDLTRDLVFAGGTVQIKILDHLIIGNNRYFSFAGEDLISQYEMEFLGLKMKGDHS